LHPNAERGITMFMPTVQLCRLRLSGASSLLVTTSALMERAA
jgi:hypothetical protein